MIINLRLKPNYLKSLETISACLGQADSGEALVLGRGDSQIAFAKNLYGNKQGKNLKSERMLLFR